MADNIDIDPGSTTPIATEDVAGVHYQKVLLAASAGDGEVRAGAVGGRLVGFDDDAEDVATIAVSQSIAHLTFGVFIERPVTGTYAAGDAVGTVEELSVSPLTGGRLVGSELHVSDLEQEHPELNILFINSASEQVAAVVDNAAYSPGDAEFLAINQLVAVRAADYVDVGSRAIAQVAVPPILVAQEYAVVVVAASAFTLTGDGFAIGMSGPLA